MKPSALTAAAARAAHLIVDSPTIFADPLAYRILGDQAEELVAYHRAHGSHPVLAGARAAVAIRSRHTEDRLASAGLDQYVILGAGLDSFAYRTTRDIRVFEVDHPATQQWKLDHLAAASIPASATYVPVDFETDSILDQLVHNGFDRTRPAFVSWLGVTMYLTRDAIAQTLTDISAFAPGTELVLDYLLPAGLRDATGQAYADAVAPFSATNGEPWLSFFSPAEIGGVLHGFEVVASLGQHDLPEMRDRADALTASALSMIAHARLV